MQITGHQFAYKKIQSYSSMNQSVDTHAATSEMASSAIYLEEETTFVELSEEYAQAQHQEAATKAKEEEQKAQKDEKQNSLEKTLAQWKKFNEKETAKSSSATNSSSNSLTDESGKLTRRLVAAGSQFEVHEILGLASKNLISARMATASTDENTAKQARKIVRKLEKLIQRAHKKISDLNLEDGMKQEKTRAERQKEQERAEEIKQELREQIRKRKQRERKYLKDANEKDQQENALRLDAVTEARIAQQAQAIAAAEAASSSVAAGGMDMASGDGSATGGEATGGGEAASMAAPEASEGETD